MCEWASVRGVCMQLNANYEMNLSTTQTESTDDKFIYKIIKKKISFNEES